MAGFSEEGTLRGLQASPTSCILHLQVPTEHVPWESLAVCRNLRLQIGALPSAFLPLNWHLHEPSHLTSDLRVTFDPFQGKEMSNE